MFLGPEFFWYGKTTFSKSCGAFSPPWGRRFIYIPTLPSLTMTPTLTSDKTCCYWLKYPSGLIFVKTFCDQLKYPSQIIGDGQGCDTIVFVNKICSWVKRDYTGNKICDN